MPDIYHDIRIKATRSDVYEAITSPRHLVNWWPLQCSGSPEEGKDYNFFFGVAYNWWGRVARCQEGVCFYIRMTDADDDWNPTTFGFDLREEGDGVWVEFWHRNWPELNHHFRRSSCCWAILLQGLKTYIEEGIVIPFEERA